MSDIIFEGIRISISDRFTIINVNIPYNWNRIDILNFWDRLEKKLKQIKRKKQLLNYIFNERKESVV